MNKCKYCYFYGVSEGDCYNTQDCSFFASITDYLIDDGICENHQRQKNEYYDAWQDYIRDYN